MLTIKIESDYKDALKEMKTEEYDGICVMTVRDAGELLGLGTMRVFEGYASLDNIVFKDEYRDFSLEYGLGKSMLNFIDLKGIRYAVSGSEKLSKLLEALRFKPLGEVEGAGDIVGGNWLYCLNLDGYFSPNC